MYVPLSAHFAPRFCTPPSPTKHSPACPKFDHSLGYRGDEVDMLYRVGMYVCRFIHFPGTHLHLHNIPLELECRVAILSFTDYISITQIYRSLIWPNLARGLMMGKWGTVVEEGA